MGIFGFRPLSGIMFSIGWKTRTRNSRPRSFPSPLGDYVFNHAYNSAILCINKSVSVPSRGLCFQSGIVAGCTVKSFIGFRPLSGIMFSIDCPHRDTYRRLPRRFPSPLGDYVFNLEAQQILQVVNESFPSPLGDYVFNRLCRK